VTAFSSTWATTMSPLRAVVCGRMSTKSPGVRRAVDPILGVPCLEPRHHALHSIGDEIHARMVGAGRPPGRV